MAETAFPLQWPPGRKRKKYPIEGAFKLNTGKDRVQNEMIWAVERMGGKGLVISTNVPIRKDGFPYSNYRQPDDQGVAVYFSRGEDRVCFACDQYDRIWKNMRAITKTIEAMRGIERWGSKEMLDQAFTGFAALPPPGDFIEMPGPGQLPRPWHDVLEVAPDAPWNEIRSAWRAKMREATDAEKLPINLAFEAAKKIHGDD